MDIHLNQRRRIMTLYRYHYPGSPAEAAGALLDQARELALTERVVPIGGETLRHWATDAKAPQWAVLAAAQWLLMQEGLEISQMDRQALATLQAPAAGNEKKVSHVKNFD